MEILINLASDACAVEGQFTRCNRRPVGTLELFRHEWVIYATPPLCGPICTSFEEGCASWNQIV
jgi:hypothetical protein